MILEGSRENSSLHGCSKFIGGRCLKNMFALGGEIGMFEGVEVAVGDAAEQAERVVHVSDIVETQPGMEQFWDRLGYKRRIDPRYMEVHTGE